MSLSKNLVKCSVGQYLEEECHSTTHTRSTGFKRVDSLSLELVDLFTRRTGIQCSPELAICNHHEQAVLVKYSSLQRKCCDPFLRHKNPVRGSLREISLETASEFEQLNISVVPGRKICPSCRRDLSKEIEKLKNAPEDSGSDPDFECDESPVVQKESLNRSFEEIGVSPVKLHSVPSHSRIPYGKRKLEQVKDKLSNEQAKFKKQVADVMNIPEESLKEESKEPEDYDQLKRKAADLDDLIEKMKEKIKKSDRRKIIQILTLIPQSWSIQKAINKFDVTEYMVKQAREITRTQGILEFPEKKLGKVLSEEVRRRVLEFYTDDEYSRQMPGKKDCVSVKRNVHVQKRLLLCNLKELYASFKQKNPEMNIGFSKFCTLRPKWCVLAGSSGSHSVCVCTIHQNVKLMINAVKLDKDQHELVDMLVCSRNFKECMIHRCINCPAQDLLEDYLHQQLHDESDDDEDCLVYFQQWTTVDRSELVSHSLPLIEFIALLVKKLNDLTSHSYIASAQAKYLKQCKENLAKDEIVILGDFAENFKFVIQDEVQSYHWNQQSCTLHPVVIYSRPENEVQEHSLCMISNDLTHDTECVYRVLSEAITFAREKVVTNLRKVFYFSDGCAGQYKNCKNFLNLCHHERDFQVSCSWTFFATSHGKSPCDGLGGTIKRLAARASLQRPLSDQILTAEQLYEFCLKEVQGISVFFLSKEEIDETRQFLAKRFQNVHTLPGTRSFHQFEPISESAIGAKRVSEDTRDEMQYDLRLGKKADNSASEINPSDFVICQYDEKHWLGLVDIVDRENKDFKVKFMHPAYPAKSYFWPRREDSCFVPDVKVLCKVNAPVTATGRQYHLLEEANRTVKEHLFLRNF